LSQHQARLLAFDDQLRQKIKKSKKMEELEKEMEVLKKVLEK